MQTPDESEEKKPYNKYLKELYDDRKNKNYREHHNSDILEGKIGFLEEAIRPNATSRRKTPINCFADGVKLSDDQNGAIKEIFTFLINTNLINSPLGQELGLASKNTSLGSYVWSSLGNYTVKTIDFGPLVTMVGLAVAPALVLMAAGSGAVDSYTRTQLNPDEQNTLFKNLGQLSILSSIQKQAIFDNIIHAYLDERSQLIPKSNSSKNLISTLSSSNLNATEKWDSLVSYMTDLNKNNGKALFLTINETIANNLDPKRGNINTEGFDGRETPSL